MKFMVPGRSTSSELLDSEATQSPSASYVSPLSCLNVLPSSVRSGIWDMLPAVLPLMPPALTGVRSRGPIQVQMEPAGFTFTLHVCKLFSSTHLNKKRYKGLWWRPFPRMGRGRKGGDCSPLYTLYKNHPKGWPLCHPGQWPLCALSLAGRGVERMGSYLPRKNAM